MRKADTIDKFLKTLILNQKLQSLVNPHCETTLKYNEDDKILRPVIKKFNEGVKVMVHTLQIQFFN